MKPSLLKLQKFLKLEAERGYDNRAVMGGLERMLTPWGAEARAEGLAEELVAFVLDRLRDYQRLTPKSRAEVLAGLWRRLERESGKTLPPLPEWIEPATAEASASGEPPAAKALAPDPSSPARLEGLPPQPTEEPEDSYPAKVAPARQATPLAQKPAPAIRPGRRQPEGPPAALNASTTVLPGVGARHAQTLARLGLNTLGDMLYYFPRRYDDYTKLRQISRLFYGEEVTVIGTLQSINLRPIRNNRFQIVEALLADGSGALRVTWFNQPWIAKRLRPGMQIVLSGKIDQYLGRLVMNNPEWEPLEQQNLSTNRIVPVYSLTANITQRWLRRLMFQVVQYWAPRLADYLPEDIRREGGLIDLSTALLQAHFPDSVERLRAARERLAFDEICLLQLGVQRQKVLWQNRTARTFSADETWLNTQVARLPFQLTGAQQNALNDVLTDLASGQPMNRLLQGDVGSGKTVIAALGVAVVTQPGAQAAFMAPTSILAEQHYQTLQRLLAGAPQRVNIGEDDEPEGADLPSESLAMPLHPEEIRLMLGATPEAEKAEIRAGLQDGSIKLVIGTHALIEDPVTFADLQLIIVDEQHRFGVEQRAALRSKGNNPHLLVMTATPIPRSLALTVYGDLDLSVMDEMPPGRLPVDTHVLYPRERERAYALIRGQLGLGKQAFIIYPLIEENENTETPAAVVEHERLQREIFPDCRLGLLHGRLKPEEKDAVMEAFRSGEIQILVSTSVVEVGVDVPQATVMLVEGANRFGLAQLHQFRGRVGRGTDPSYCLLIPETADEAENERLSAMAQTNDGFVLAEKDLEQRGPGDFLGTRQSGYMGLKLASLTDVHLIEKARQLSQVLFQRDPNFSKPENTLLAAMLKRVWGESFITSTGDIS